MISQLVLCINRFSAGKFAFAILLSSADSTNTDYLLNTKYHHEESYSLLYWVAFIAGIMLGYLARGRRSHPGSEGVMHERETQQITRETQKAGPALEKFVVQQPVDQPTIRPANARLSYPPPPGTLPNKIINKPVSWGKGVLRKTQNR